MRDTSVGRKVLIVEDDQVYANLLANYLVERSFDVMVADTGAGALARIAEQPPNVVLCDLKLPDISGLAILEKILQSPDAVPVIVISASDDMRDIREAVRLGAVDYLVKPVQQLDVLEFAIENCLTRSSIERTYEREHWELDNHLEILFQDDAVIARLSQDLEPHEDLFVQNVRVDHELGERDNDRTWIDYYRLGPNQLIMLMARAQALAGQDMLALLVLKTMFNPILRTGLSGNMQLLSNPQQLLTRLNNELSYSRIKAAFDLVCVWVNTESKEVRWAQAGDKIMLSHESQPDLAMGIWSKASYKLNKTQLDRAGFYLACDKSWLRASLLLGG